MENQEKPKRKLKNLDLIILLSVLAVSIVCSSAVAQLSNQAEGSDFDIYIDYGGLAFQDGNNPSCFIAIYTPVGALNSSDNELWISAEGGGWFEFVANESVSLQFLRSVSANIEGDQGNGVRMINATATGLSPEYPVDEGDHVKIYWAPTIMSPLSIPSISAIGFIAGMIFTPLSAALTIKKKKLSWLWITLIAALTTFVFFLLLYSGV